MARRSVDWNIGLAKDLKNKTFAQKFIKYSLEEGMSLQIVLGKVIRLYGVKEFSRKIKMAPPNVLRAINSRHNPTISTLNRLLAPFSLEINVVPLSRKRVA